MDSNYLGGDLESNLNSSTTEKTYKYFWQKSSLYRDEKRVWKTNIPAWRFFLSICMIYGIFIGIDFCASLCTAGFQFLGVVSLISATTYVYWALWWDEPIIIPPTQTFFNVTGYSSIASLFLICYETCLVGLVVFCVFTALLFTYVSFEDIFKWQC